MFGVRTRLVTRDLCTSLPPYKLCKECSSMLGRGWNLPEPVGLQVDSTGRRVVAKAEVIGEQLQIREQ